MASLECIDVQKIIQLREAKSLSQSQLQDKANIPHGTLCRLEKNKKGASLIAIVKIAQALEVKIDELILKKDYLF